MMQGVANSHLCHVELLEDSPPAGFTVSNWGFHRFLASHRWCFCLFGTSGRTAECGRLGSMKGRRG